MRAPRSLLALPLLAASCSSGGGAGAGGSDSGSMADPCTGLQLQVMGDGLPQTYTMVSGHEASGSLVITGSGNGESLTLTSDKLGSTTSGHVGYTHGTHQFSGDQAMITVTTLGDVGEAIAGSYVAIVNPSTVGITLNLSGDFRVCRAAP